MLRASEEFVDDPPGRFREEVCEIDPLVPAETGGAGAGRLPRT